MTRRPRLLAVLAIVLSVAGAVTPGFGDPPPADAQAAPGFVGLTPARLWETRRAGDLVTVDGLAEGTGALGPGATYTLQVTGRGGVPATGVDAVALNVTAIAPSEPSFLTVYPTGTARPNASNLNLVPGAVIPNVVLVPVGSGGRVTIYQRAGRTDVVADVLGYVASGSDLTATSPSRLLDTRDGPTFTTVDGEFAGNGRLGANRTLRLDVAGRAGLPADGVGGVIVNVAAVAPSADSYVTVHPAGSARPNASNLNTAPGRTLPNLVFVRLSDDGRLDLFNRFGDVDLVVDLLAWVPTGSSTFEPVGPERLMDTRVGTGIDTVDGRVLGDGAFGGGERRRLQIAGRGAVPASGAGAVALNVTAVGPTAASFVTVWPAGRPRPDASNLNLAPGRTLPNVVLVPLPASGAIDIFNLAGSTDIVVDVLGWFPGPPAAGVNAAVAGALTAPHPTIEHISLVWSVTGDADGDARVGVRYRQQGAATWIDGMPLRRVPGGSNEGFTWTTRHAGSLFGLAAGTTYEVEARLVDADGGSSTRMITATTRTVPRPAPGAPVTVVTPATLGQVLAAAEPGDIVQLGAGQYPGFTIGASGAPGAPIVVRGTPGAVVDGEIGIFLQHDVHVTDLTVNGRIRFNGTDRVAITGNTINASTATEGHGIITYLPAEDGYIADNVVNGTTTWNDAALGANGANLGEGILVTGPGHVIEHNRVTGMRDGISFLEDSGAVDQYSIDVLDNDIRQAADDGVEADFCEHDCRIMRNRLTNTFVALSAQPTLGGPTYFVGNTAYNVAHVAFKLYRGSSGDVIVHNTVVKAGDAFGNYAGTPVSNLSMRNNLFIGGPGGTFGGYGNGTGRVFDVRTLDETTADADHDGFGSTVGSFTGNFGGTSFGSLADLRASSTEANAVAVGMSEFAAGVAHPSAPLTQYAPVDLRLGAGSVAVDAGVALPGLNDGFSGSAPDLGAHERGAALPQWGPRP